MISALASGAFAIVLVLISGNARETWINLQVVLFRIMAFGHYLGADRRLESEMTRTDRRRRLVPFGAMVALGLAAVLFWSIYPEVMKFID
jgi:hypothetical protein